MQSATKKKIVLHLRITTREIGGETLRSFLRMAVPFYQAPQGIAVRLLRNRADPTRFVEVIEYDDEEAFEHDAARVRSDPEMRRLLERWRSLLVGGIEVEVFEDETDRIGGED